ncbi:unnamed protein product [Cylicocyclus nassatus]|uniref:Uncharacterized protein n=1 Tax=Cylicocyclus nassatus TaxID=53992 RepID=A0AA36GP83_CYLNA|nr:unnamed protein product [Cylicocyclus nassatus]
MLAKFLNLEIEITNEVVAVAGNELVLEDCELYRKAEELAVELCADTTTDCGKYDCVNQTRSYTDDIKKLAFYYEKTAYMLFGNLDKAYKTILVESPKARQLEVVSHVV